MLLEFCTQYANKFGKLSSGHRTGKGQFSFQSQRRAMPKNVQTTAQLHVCGNFHIISDDSKPVFKTLQLGFNSTWTENFQMYKLHLEKAEEPEIKPVNPKGNQPWIFIGRTDTEAEAPVFWSPNVNSWLIGKSLMLGKNEGRRKASGGDGIPIELFQILRDDPVKVLHSICQQIWKTQQ